MTSCTECSSSCLSFSCKAGWKALYTRVAVGNREKLQPFGSSVAEFVGLTSLWVRPGDLQVSCDSFEFI